MRPTKIGPPTAHSPPAPPSHRPLVLPPSARPCAQLKERIEYLLSLMGAQLVRLKPLKCKITGLPNGNYNVTFEPSVSDSKINLSQAHRLKSFVTETGAV